MVYNLFGYKVFKENDTPLGYDKSDNGFVVNLIEAEFVRYIHDVYVNPKKKIKTLPEHWVKYLEEKNEEYKKLKKENQGYKKLKNAVRIKQIKIDELIENDEQTPIIGKKIWEQVQEKICENQNEESGMEINL